MTDDNFWPRSSRAPRPPACGRLPDARLDRRGRRRRPGGLAAAEPLGLRRGRQPARLADDGGRPRLPRHAPRPQGPPRAARRSSRADRQRGHRGEPGRGGRAGGLDRAGDARGAGEPLPRRARGLRAARHVRRPLQRDRRDLGPQPDAARQLASRARRRVRGSVPPADADVEPSSGASSTHSLQPPAPATSRHCSRCSTPTSSSASTRSRATREQRPPAVGAEQVARQALAGGRRFAPYARPATVNGAPGLIVETPQRRIGVMGCTVKDGRITAVDLVLEPPPGHESSRASS